MSPAKGSGQSRTGPAARGCAITFGISIENGGAGAADFTVKAMGSATSAYAVKYCRGTNDITVLVVAGSSEVIQ